MLADFITNYLNDNTVTFNATSKTHDKTTIITISKRQIFNDHSGYLELIITNDQFDSLTFYGLNNLPLSLTNVTQLIDYSHILVLINHGIEKYNNNNH